MGRPDDENEEAFRHVLDDFLGPMETGLLAPRPAPPQREPRDEFESMLDAFYGGPPSDPMQRGDLSGRFAGLDEALEGPIAQALGARSVPGSSTQVNSEPAGALTGAPTRTGFRRVAVYPQTNGRTPSCICGPERASRVVTLVAPAVAFSIFIGGPGVTVAEGQAIAPTIPYSCSLVGFDELYAVSNSPVVLYLMVQVAPILAGDRERPAPPEPVTGFPLYVS